MDSIYSLKSHLGLFYYEMLVDKNRNQFYYDCLFESAANKVVLDLGTGTGILAHYALSAGAKFVYAIEQQPVMAEYSHNVLSQSFSKDKFKVICKDFWDKSTYELIDKTPDLVVSETVGYGLFDQNMIKTWATLSKFLNSSIISIPDQLSIDAWIFDDVNDVNICDPTDESVLNKDDVIDVNFFKALIFVENAIDNVSEIIKPKSALLKKQPSKVIKNLIAYRQDNLPSLDIELNPRITVEILLDKPCVVSLVNKIEYKERCLYLKDAKKMPWRFSPSFILNKPGKYELIYEIKDRNHYLDTGWFMKKIN
jgi:SAM-dependent methyltransferase